MLCSVMLVEPSCFIVGWKGTETVPAAEGVGAPNGEVVGAAPKAGVGAAVYVWRR